MGNESLMEAVTILLAIIGTFAGIMLWTKRRAKKK